MAETTTPGAVGTVAAAAASAATSAKAMIRSEQFLNIASTLTLVAAGLFFLYEGAVLINFYNQNPQKVSKKMAVAGSITIVLGVASLILAGLHVFIFPKSS
jgi:uncharacterized membrane protein